MALLMVKLDQLKDGTYVARKVIPSDVRDDYAKRFGIAWEAKFRLEQPVSQHAAKVRFTEWLAEVETRIETLRAARRNGPRPLTRQNAFALAGRWYQWF